MESIGIAQPLILIVLILGVVGVGKLVGRRKSDSAPDDNVFESEDVKSSPEQPDTTNPKLMPCPDCRSMISRKAPNCPSCGAVTKFGKKTARRERNNKRGNRQGCGCLLILLAIALGLTGLGVPFAGIIGFVGLVVLIIGLFS